MRIINNNVCAYQNITNGISTRPQHIKIYTENVDTIGCGIYEDWDYLTLFLTSKVVQ